MPRAHVKQHLSEIPDIISGYGIAHVLSNTPHPSSRLAPPHGIIRFLRKPYTSEQQRFDDLTITRGLLGGRAPRSSLFLKMLFFLDFRIHNASALEHTHFEANPSVERRLNHSE